MRCLHTLKKNQPCAHVLNVTQCIEVTLLLKKISFIYLFPEQSDDELVEKQIKDTTLVNKKSLVSEWM